MMNGKKAKLFRKVGKALDKKGKRLYNMLPHQERETLGNVYNMLLEKHGPAFAAQKAEPKINSIHPSGLNRKQRAQAARTVRQASPEDIAHARFKQLRAQVAEQNLKDQVTEAIKEVRDTE